ncbi:hypothetical protein D3C80_1133430 [compost metagenome]
MGWADINLDHRVSRDRRRAAAGYFVGAWPSFNDAGSACAFSDLYRVLARRTADYRAVYVVGDVAIIHGGRYYDRQADPRTRRRYFISVRLCRRSRSRWATGSAKRTIRSG